MSQLSVKLRATLNGRDAEPERIDFWLAADLDSNDATSYRYV
jgi:hypothetical protein